MTNWAFPRFRPDEVNKAGAYLVNPDTSRLSEDRALEIIGNWRSCHAFPLNTFRMGLWQRVRDDHPEALVVQRLKRLPSIRAKLIRESAMKLTQMQDIGGCRAVLPDIAAVYDIRRSYAKSRPSRFRHQFASEKDYISQPKGSGYRSYHLVYKFNSPQNAPFNGLKIEIQLRTELQHAWATAVETVDTLTRQSIKASRGAPDWERFFSLMGTAVAVLEDSPPVPNTVTDTDELRRELGKLVQKLDVFDVLRAYGLAIKEVEGKSARRAKYFLLDLHPKDKVVTVREFGIGDIEAATTAYLETEKQISGPGAEAVLVSGGSIEDLRLAYPNYFLNTEIFLGVLQSALGEALEPKS